MVFNNFTQTNGGLQSGGYSVPDESYYPYSPASISSNGSPVGWAGQNVNSSSYLEEQAQVATTSNNSPGMVMPISPIQRHVPIPTIVSMDDSLPSCSMAKIPSGNNQPATAAPAKQGAKPKKPTGVKRARTAYSSHQLATLERGFRRNPYVNRNERIYLAESLELSEKQIKIWYQNRRMKLKKETEAKSGSTPKPMRPKKKAPTPRATRRASRKTSTCSSINSLATNSPPPFDAHRASMMTPPDEIVPMMQVPRASCLYEDVNNHQRFRQDWIANGGAVNAFQPQQQPIQWQNAEANYVAVQQPAWNVQQFPAVNHNAAYYQGPSASSSNNNQRPIQEPNIFMENYQLPVLGDLSAWLDTPQDQIVHPNLTNL